MVTTMTHRWIELGAYLRSHEAHDILDGAVWGESLEWQIQECFELFGIEDTGPNRKQFHRLLDRVLTEGH
jgi:hypothetical protein